MFQTGLEEVQVAQAQDGVLGPIISALQQGENMAAGLPQGLQKTFLQGQVLCLKFRETATTATHTQVVIPKSTRQSVLKQLHDQAGLLGIFNITEKVKEQFYWPGDEQVIRIWVQNCVQCHQRNPPQPQTQAPLHGHHAPTLFMLLVETTSALLVLVVDTNRSGSHPTYQQYATLMSPNQGGFPCIFVGS